MGRRQEEDGPEHAEDECLERPNATTSLTPTGRRAWRLDGHRSPRLRPRRSDPRPACQGSRPVAAGRALRFTAGRPTWPHGQQLGGPRIGGCSAHRTPPRFPDLPLIPARQPDGHPVRALPSPCPIVRATLEPGVSAENHGTKSILAAFVANLGIAMAKFGGFLVTGSGSMLAEWCTRVADTAQPGAADARRAAAPARARPADHPFGFGRERYFWAFVVAVVLFTLGAAFAIFDGIEKILHPHEIEQHLRGRRDPRLWRCCSRASASARRSTRPGPRSVTSTSLWRYIRESKSPEVPVVLLEDSAALCGLVVALVAILLSHLRGTPLGTGSARSSSGCLLGVVAIVLAIEMKSLLIGEAASPERRQAIHRGARLLAPGAFGHPPAHRAPRARRPARRGQGRVRRRTSPTPRWPPRSTKPR